MRIKGGRRIKGKLRLLVTGLALTGIIWTGNLTHNSMVIAAFQDNPNLTFSPDGKAFTTDAGDTAVQWYERGTISTLHGGPPLAQPAVGEHLYAYSRQIVPVGRWEVMLQQGKCIHDAYTTASQFHGVAFQKKKCGKYYFSGWMAYCADCGQQITDFLVYMKLETAASISVLDTSLAYYYKCPWCDNLEQGADAKLHICQGISANQYYVEYMANGGEGRMGRSVHMYGNAAVYEGETVQPQTTLSRNLFEREGYCFVGWNSVPDGSGSMFGDEEEIYNLCEGERETMVLYAQWERQDREQDTAAWPVRTTKLMLSGAENIAPGDSEDVWYVKADGSTPFTLFFMGILEGRARENYQIDHMGLRFGEEMSGSITVLVPGRIPVEAGTYVYLPEELEKQYAGTVVLADAASPEARRLNACRTLEVTQQFTAARALDGCVLRLTPWAGASYEGGMARSEEEDDQVNGLYLIPDGRPPQLLGGELSEQLEILRNGTAESVVLEWQASDSGSGLQEFYVELYNRDSGQQVRFSDEGSPGRIAVELTAEDPILLGSAVVTVCAVDRVGNETVLEQEAPGFGVTARVERMLEPHDPIFKRGESGILYITAMGYADRVEVRFPEAFSALDPALDRDFWYLDQEPQALQREELTFMIPLEAPEGTWQICVLAYKNAEAVSCEPELLTFSVQGSVLEELRTRLR